MNGYSTTDTTQGELLHDDGIGKTPDLGSGVFDMVIGVCIKSYLVTAYFSYFTAIPRGLTFVDSSLFVML